MGCKISQGGFICGRGHGTKRKPPACDFCKVLDGKYQCDKTINKDPNNFQTCDKWVCESCNTHAGPNTDYCPEHKPEVQANV